jgi:cytochrome c biogenesis protein CcdA
MKIRWVILLAPLWLLPTFVSAAQIEFFYEPGCEVCEQIEELILPRLEPQLKIVRRDVGVESNLVYLLRMENQSGYAGQDRGYLALNGRQVFGNPLDDPEAFFSEVERWMNVGQASSLSAPAECDPVRSRFEQMTLPVVLLAGLLDGINPCAISTLAFFMSLLAVSRVRNRQLLAVGVSFCVASFLTYLAIGFGLLRFLHLFSGLSFLRNTLERGLAALLLLLAFLSFRDALRFRKSGKGADVTLQLSAGMKQRIHSVMRSGLKSGHLILGGLLIGAGVTALESVCTGQVYVPTLVLILKNSALADSRALLYLLAYNLLFILPLVLVFIAVYSGLRSETLLRWSSRNVVFSKTLLGVFFIGLALFFLFL